MKFKIGMLTVAAAGALIAIQSVKAPAGFGFSNAASGGSYASIFQSSVIQGSSLLPINGTAVLMTDGNGNISGHESFVYDGTICILVTSRGAYTVNPDGSGTAYVHFINTECCRQSLAIAESVLNNTNAGNRISETWRQQNSSLF